MWIFFKEPVFEPVLFFITHTLGEWCNGPLQYLDPPGPKTALASYPGSGNTWVRYLIQHISGYITGSVYNDHSLKKIGFPGEGETNGKVIAIKTHQNS